jgi:hypothetical protein
MPMPPMPTKCTGPMSRGNLMRFLRLENGPAKLLFCARCRHL